MLAYYKRVASLALLCTIINCITTYATSDKLTAALCNVDFDRSMELDRLDPHRKSDDPIVKLCRKLFKKNKPTELQEKKEPIIPKKLHLIWLGPKTPPAIFKECRESIKKYLPDWELYLWRDEDVPALNLYNQEYYDEETNFAAKSDILRYEILYKFGGIYIDVDIELIKCLDLFIHTYEFFVGLEGNDNDAIIGNSIIASIPGHPILLDSIQQIKNHRDTMEDWKVVKRTGPLHFQQSFYSVAKKHQDRRIIAFPKSFFYPISFKDRTLTRAQQKDLVKPETCCIHYWAGSWISKS